MKKVYLDINKLQEEGGDNVTLGNYSKIGIASTIKYSVTIGDCVSIGYSSDIADDATIGNGIEILSGYIIKGVIIIQMGCHTRTLEEWELDFWNNDREFKRGTPEGEKRLSAFNKIKKIMEHKLKEKKTINSLIKEKFITPIEVYPSFNREEF